MSSKYIDFYVMPLDYAKANNELSQWRLTAYERHSNNLDLNAQRITLATGSRAACYAAQKLLDDSKNNQLTTNLSNLNNLINHIKSHED